MAGHSKWANIKRRKEASDAARGKLFAKLSKEITVAARQGDPSPDKNPVLRAAIDAAKAQNMPNDNIERARKKGTGELGGGPMEELTYEGFAPGEVAVMVFCLSDNRNRTATQVRTCFSKNNGKLGTNGAVNWIFQRKASFNIESGDLDEETILEKLLDAGVDIDDLEVTEGTAQIWGAPESFGEIASALRDTDFTITESQLTMLPKTTASVNDAHTARQVLKLIDALEDEDDVQQVFTNYDIPDEILEEIASE